MLLEVVGNIANHSGEPEGHGFLTQFGRVLESVAVIVSLVIIAFGLIVAIYRIVQGFFQARSQNSRTRLDRYQMVRLGLGRYLALALEFQLAADIVATSIEPSWQQLGRLGAVALIRTFLNYFLGREIAEEEETAKAGE